MSDNQPPVALSIAGSDSGGGAGIQADLKAMTYAGVHGTTALTALTAQNSVGVQGIHAVPPSFLRKQINSIITDFSVQATKTGMLFSDELIEVVCDFHDRLGTLVVDPVMVAESGDSLLDPAAESMLVEKFLPRADLITPNLPETQVIAKRLGISESSPIDVARLIAEKLEGPMVLLKGGHSEEEEAIDHLMSVRGEEQQFRGPRYSTDHTHGSGCAYSSLIAAGLAHGLDMIEAVREAKSIITRAIKNGYAIGEGPGTLNFLRNESMEAHYAD